MPVTAAPPTYLVQGSDLALTRYVGTPSAAPLASADSWGSLDLQVVAGGSGGLRLPGPVQDLGTVAGRENLAQALTLRLLTAQGALEALGHPDYGSRLVTLIGRSNDQPTRNLARLYVIEAVRQERRVQALTALSVTPAPGQPDTLQVALTVKPVNDAAPLSLTLEVTL
jgi:phage baseplate assembly protein W